MEKATEQPKKLTKFLSLFLSLPCMCKAGLRVGFCRFARFLASEEQALVPPLASASISCYNCPNFPQQEAAAVNVSELISESGISIGSLTLTAALQALATLLVGLVLIRIMLNLMDRAFDRSDKLKPLKKHIRPIIKALLGVLLALVVLDSLGVKVTSFIALLSVAGLAVSLALQNSLSNIAGGIMIVTAQPYGIGDYVSIGGTEGTVDFIRLSYTKLHTPDNKEVQIPNSTVAGAIITNYNRLGCRRMDLKFTASYDAPTEDVYAALHDAMARFPQILPIPVPETHVTDYGASSIEYLARLWVKPADYWTVYWGVIEAVRETFAAHNVEMTYDHLNVHMEK